MMEMTGGQEQPGLKEQLEERNQKIIDAVIEKEKRRCPGALALIGVYGSFLTGDIHPRSDLDLLILINDERGWQLGCTFLEDDRGIGHDIYCTSWDSLREDAAYAHPQIAKLMDARVVYCADEKYRAELEKLREQVRKTLAAPLSLEDLEKAERQLKEAQACAAAATGLCDAAVSGTPEEALTRARAYAGGVLYYLECALALLNKTYFKKGVRRCYEELTAMKKRPAALVRRIEDVVAAGDLHALKESLEKLMTETEKTFREERAALGAQETPPAAAQQTVPAAVQHAALVAVSEDASAPVQTVAPAECQPAPEVSQDQPAEALPLPTPDDLHGSYEEMVSNWRGKMFLAAETGDRHLAFMSLASLQSMFDDIAGEVAIGACQAFSAYDPNDLYKTMSAFDELLQEYRKEYDKIGLRVCRYPDTDAFVTDYLRI